MTQQKALERNLIESIECPNCGNRGEFHISAEMLLAVDADGVSLASVPEWFDDSPCICPRCKNTGVISDFAQNKIRPNVIRLTDQELNQVLAALRHWAHDLPEVIEDERYSEYTEDGIEWLDEPEINALCERFVLGPIGE